MNIIPVRRFRAFALLAALVFPAMAHAAGALAPKSVAETIRKAIQDLPISEVRETPVKGLYEIRVRNTLYYATTDGKHLIVGGHLFETATHRDLTRERLEEINRIDWKKLPLEDAIVSGDPKAKLKLAVFTDPECPYCKRLETILKDMKDVRVYTFLFPLTQLHPEARRKAEAIWCSKNRHETLLKSMLEGVDPGHATCDNPIDKTLALGRKLGVAGTPTLFAGDGRRMSGAPRTAEALREWLARK